MPAASLATLAVPNHASNATHTKPPASNDKGQVTEKNTARETREDTQKTTVKDNVSQEKGTKESTTEAVQKESKPFEETLSEVNTKEKPAVTEAGAESEGLEEADVIASPIDVPTEPLQDDVADAAWVQQTLLRVQRLQVAFKLEITTFTTAYPGVVPELQHANLLNVDPENAARFGVLGEYFDDVVLPKDILPEQVLSKLQALQDKLEQLSRNIFAQLVGKIDGAKLNALDGGVFEENVTVQLTSVQLAWKELKQPLQQLNTLSQLADNIRKNVSGQVLGQEVQTQTIGEARQALASLFQPSQFQQKITSTTLAVDYSFASAAASALDEGVQPAAYSNTGKQLSGQDLPQQAHTLPVGTSAGEPGALEEGRAEFRQFLRNAPPTLTQQVQFQLKTVMVQNRHHIQIQLEPEELGKLDIRMEVRADGKTGLTVTAETRQALDLLQRDMRELERILGDAGLKADAGAMQFNLKGDQGQQQGSFKSKYNAQISQDPVEEELARILPSTYVLHTQDGVDIRT